MAVWGPLGGKAGTLGYPIFADFNPHNYSRAYELAVVLFPLAALLIFLGLTRIGPRLGLATPPPRGPLRPTTPDTEADADAAPDEQTLDATSSPAKRDVIPAARVAFVGAVLGLEIGVASNRLWPTIAVVAIAYGGAIGLCSAAVWRLRPTRSAFIDVLAAANALGASLGVAGLVLVSAHTEVRILADHSTQRYPWFPAWAGLPLCALLLGWMLVALRRAGLARAAAIERRAVFLVAAPVALLVLVAHLPGDLGQLNLYEEGQLVTETRLIGQGWLPWRDVVLAHGLLGDVAPVATGSGVFGNSYWGTVASQEILFFPSRS